MDDKPLQALANKLKTPAQESQRNGFFRLQQVKNNQPRITGIPVNHQGPSLTSPEHIPPRNLPHWRSPHNTRFRLLSNCSGVSSACSTGCMSDFL